MEVEDLGSRTGTLINGQRFDRTRLVVGDRLRIGPYSYRFDGAELRLSGDGAPVVFQNVRVTAGDRTILDGVTCGVPAGAFAGILGPSGAGKSTLIRCAAHLIQPAAGLVSSGGEESLQGYVPQDDIVHVRLTPRQALSYAARLRLRRDLPRAQIQAIVDGTLGLLDLADRAETRIDRLSGGQRKRVSVATELLARPDVLFLDEPTSGLDPAAEMRLMEALRRLATAGCTVLCTTHIVENVFLMDRLLILAGGRLVFSGSPDEAKAHFGVSRFQEIYPLVENAEAVQAAESLQWPGGREVVRDESREGAGRTRRSGALPVLLSRMSTLLLSEPRQAFLLLLQPVLVALLLGWASDDPALILFFAGIATLWFGCSNASEEIVREVPIYLRERFAGVARSAYIASKFLWMGMTTTLQGFLLYGVCQLTERGLAGDWRWQLGAIGLSALSGIGIGLAVSAAARSARQAILAIPLLLIPQILLSGFTVPAHEMTPIVRRVSSFLPSYATQLLNDTSFVWNQTLARDVLKDFWTSFRNLNERGDLKTGEIFSDAAAARWGIGIHGFWVLASLALVWVGLRSKERLGG